ncbi:hypothetical protein NL676_007385 [Syzygium grande]|nr:hypothetical protein NL676_007385 [Syzygium grande]
MGTTDWKVAPSLIREQWRRRAEINSGVVVKWSVASAVGFDYSGRTGIKQFIDNKEESTRLGALQLRRRREDRGEASSGWCSRRREAATGGPRRHGAATAAASRRRGHKSGHKGREFGHEGLGELTLFSLSFLSIFLNA